MMMMSRKSLEARDVFRSTKTKRHPAVKMTREGEVGDGEGKGVKRRTRIK